MRPLLIAILYIGSAIGASWAANQLFAPAPSKRASSTEDRPAEPPIIDLGEIWESPAQAVPIPFQNDGPVRLDVADVRLSCQCTSLAPKAFSIEPGGVARPIATIDLTHRMPREIGQPSRPFRLSFEPVTKEGLVATPVRVKAIIRSRLTSDRLDLHFGESCIRGEPPVTRTVRATAHVPARMIRARVDPRVASTAVTPSSDEPTQFDVSVTPDLSLPAGLHAARLAITIVDESGAEQFGAVLPITFTLLAERPLFPRQVYLPSGRIGVARSTWLEADTRTKRRIAVTSVSSDSPEVRVRIGEAASESLPRLEVTVTPSKGGAGTAKLTVYIKDEATGTTEQFPVELLYTAE